MEMTPPVLPSVAYLPHPLAIDARKFLPATYAPTRTLRDHLIAAGIDPHREIVVFVNHRMVEVAEWDVLVPIPGDCIVVEAVVSGGDGSNPIASLLSIALMVFAPMLGEALNVALFSAESSFAFALSNAALGGLIAIGGNMMISTIFSAQQPSSASKSIKQESPTYSLSGGSNRLRQYEPLPLLMGQHRIFPDYGAKPYTEFEGDDQYLYQVFNFGIGNLVIEDLRIGETLLSSYSEVTVTRATGADLPGFWGNVDTVDGAALTYAAGWITRTTGLNTQRIAVDIVGTFYAMDDDGDMLYRGATFGMEYCETGTNNWQPFIPDQVQAAQYYWSRGTWQEIVSDPYYGEDDLYHPGETSLVWVQRNYDTNLSPSAHTDGGMIPNLLIWRWVPVGSDPYPASSYINSLSQIELGRKSTKPLRKTIVRDVPAGQYDVRVRRLVPDETNISASSSAEWAAMRSYQEGTADYTGQTVIGVKIKATAQLNGVIEQLSALGTRAVSQWNGTEWVTAPTTNPAWWFLDLARGWRDAGGRLWYGGGLADSRIDLEGLKAWATFCTANGLTFSAVFDTSQTLADALNAIARCGFASCSWASGKLGVVWDAPNQSPVMAFGMSNIVKGSFEVAYITSNLADEIIVNYTNRNRNWEADQVRVTVPGTVGTPVKPSPIDLMGCTANAMAGKFANAMAAQQKYRRRSITWEADFEGMVCQRGDVVILSHDLTQWGYSGRLVSVAGNTVTLSRTVPRGTGTDYLMIERPDGSMVTASIPAGTGETDTLTLSTPITLQDGYGPLEHKWFFSPLPTPGKKVKISGVQPLSAARIRLTATDEYPEYYAAWNGVFTAPPRQTLLDQNQVSVSDLALTLNQVIVDAYQLNRVTAAWRQRGPVESCTVSAWLDGQAVGTWTGVRDASHVIDLSEQTGTLIVEVTPLAASGPGAPVRATINLSTLPAPAAPVLTVTGGLFMVEATWVFGDARSDVAYTELWFASTNNRGVAQRLTTQPYPSTRFQQLGMQPGYGGYYWARVVDTRKNPSAWFPVSATGGLHATATTDPELLLDQLEGALGMPQLAAELAEPIALIPDLATAIQTETTQRTDADNALAQQITTAQAMLSRVSLGQPLEQWVLNGQAIVTIADGKVGNKALRLSGIAGAYPNQGNFIPIDPTKVYKTRFWARPVSTTAGLLYFSLRQYLDAAGAQPGPVNGGRSPYKPSDISRAAHNAQYGADAWGEYVFTWSAADWQAGVRFVLPEFLDNYTGAAGYWEVQDFTFTEVTDIAQVQQTVSATASALEGVRAEWGVQVQTVADGRRVVGGIKLLADTDGESVLAVLADKFLGYMPDGTGAPRQVLSIGILNGVTALGFDGSAIFDGSVVARNINGTNLEVVNGSFSGTLLGADGYFNGTISAASVMAALGLAQYYDFTTAGNHFLTIPAGIDCDTIRFKIVGGAGGGGGSGGGYYNRSGDHGSVVTARSGGAGGAGGGGTSVTYDLPYASYVGVAFSITVGSPGQGGVAGKKGGPYYSPYTNPTAGGVGNPGSASVVSGVGSAAGGPGGGAGGAATSSANGSPGANSGSGTGGAGGAASLAGYYDGNPGITGATGYVQVSLFKSNSVVRSSTYQNLITWLDSIGHGAVPSNARV